MLKSHSSNKFFFDSAVLLCLIYSFQLPNANEGKSTEEGALSLVSQNTWHGRCPAPLLDQLPPSQIYERLYDVSRSLKIRAIISPQLFNLKPQIK